RNINTHIDLRNEQSDPIWIGTGVKQGDPVSPILLNLPVDPLPPELEEEGDGFQHCLRSATTTAFADDLVPLSGPWEGMQKDSGTLEVFCDPTGLETGPPQ
ncbi:PO21 protein, partial [Phaetusa simplex]|nr:PO21 protein [Phaetusa simplex]